MYTSLLESPLLPLNTHEAQQSQYRFRILRGAYLLLIFLAIATAVATS